MTRTFPYTVLVCVCLIAGVSVDAMADKPLQPATDPRGVIDGIESMPKAAAIQAEMQKHVDAGEIAGAVTMVGDDEVVLHIGAVGDRNLETEDAQEITDLFAIASMTKPITATCVMILCDEGNLSLDDSVEKYLPSFAETTLADGELPDRPITLRDCLTHTAGLAGSQAFDSSLAEAAEEIATRNLAFGPGKRWSYSPGLTVAGRIVEIVSGMSLESFMKTRLFDPLGMKDTTFFPSDDQRERVSTIYNRGKDGGPLTADSSPYNKKTKESGPNPSAGLYSTAADLFRFYRMILNGGQYDGGQIVSRESVQAMTQVQTGDLETGFTPGNGWGLGWCVIRQPQGVSECLSLGTFGHGGAFGTQAWIDPVKKRCHVLMIQRTGMLNSDASDVRRDFHAAAADSIDQASTDQASLGGSLNDSVGHWILLGANKRLVLTDPSGEVRWEMPWNSIHDIHLTDAGVILTRQGKDRVVKIDPISKRVIWEYGASKMGKGPVEIHAFEMLADGRVMVAESGRRRIVLVNEDGSIDDEIPLTVDEPNTHSDTRLVRSTTDGGFLVAHENDGKVRRYDGQGNVTWEYEVPLFGRQAARGHGPEAFGNRLFAAIEGDEGRVVIATGNGHSVLEVTGEKEIVWQIHQDDLTGIKLAWVTTLEKTPDGNLLVGNCHAGPGQPVLIELDPKTKSVIWQLDGHGEFGNSVSSSTRISRDELSAFGISGDSNDLE